MVFTNKLIITLLNSSTLNLNKNINKLCSIKLNQLLICSNKYYSSSSNYNYKLMEVGVFNTPRSENYETGQLFLHKLFGYRGVVLFPWTAHVFDKNDDSASNDASSTQYDRIASEELDRNGPPERNRAKKHTYYQVLIDSRDMPFIRSQPESVTFLSGPQSNRTVYSIHGLDYVSHSDVLPYSSTEKQPIIHDLFEKFLTFDSETKNYVGRDSLKTWQDSNHPWLELSDVCVRTTQNIRITVIPFYIGLKWRYLIRIENLTPKSPVTLRERHWRIFSQAGTFETVRGKGVVGQEPLLNGEYPVFQYSSHVNLQSPSGHMWGTFKMEKEDGTFFEARIPSFYLECKDEDKLF